MDYLEREALQDLQVRRERRDFLEFQEQMAPLVYLDNQASREEKADQEERVAQD